MDRKELKYIITAMQKGYTILDVRSKKDYHIGGHIINALCADVDPAVKGDDAPAIKNLKKAIANAGENDTYIIIDGGDGTHAGHALRLLEGLGVPADRTGVLEGGYKAWLEDDATGRYRYLIDISAEADDNVFTAALFKGVRDGELHISPEELKEAIEKGTAGEYYILDSRTHQEHEEGRFDGSVCAPTFAFYDAGGFVSREQAVKNVEDAFAVRPHREGEKFIIVCRGGRGGAQLLADVLEEAYGIDSSLVYILTYGYDVFPGSWMNLGEEYTRHIVGSQA